MNLEIDKATPGAIEKFQTEKLRETLAYVLRHSSFYKRFYKDNDIDISKINSLQDLKTLPLTTKDHLQKFNKEFLCVAPSEVIDYVTTSGTLGDPVTFALTDADLDRLAFNEAKSFACCGVTRNDVIQLMTTIDRRFMAGMAYFLGARRLGAGIVRVGSGIPALQWDSILKFKPSYLITVPSFLLKLIEYAKQHGIDPNASSVKAAICIGEPIKNQDFTDNVLAAKIKAEWTINLFSTYASTEMGTAFNECEAQRGGHLLPELIITEILDDNHLPVAAGEVGELVITTLGVEGMPLVRFKTGDMLVEHKESCTCGRNTLRLGPVIGRKKQMIKYKGTTLYPPAMFNILNDFVEVEAYVIEIFHNALGTDEIVVKVLTQHDDQRIAAEIKDHFRAKLRVAPVIEMVHAEEIQRLCYPPMSRKPIQLIDHRQK